jgi:hypothetical protein
MQEGIDKFLLYFIFIGDIMSFKHSKEKNGRGGEKGKKR